EVGGGLDPHEAPVAAHQLVVRIGPAVLRQGDQELVIRAGAGVAGALWNRSGRDDRVLVGARGRYSHSNLLHRGWSVAPSSSPEAPHRVLSIRLDLRFTLSGAAAYSPFRGCQPRFGADAIRVAGSVPEGGRKGPSVRARW